LDLIGRLDGACVFQALRLDLPYQIFLALPYVLTLAALALTRGRYAAPAALGVRAGSAS
jgi:simple sugar transport system permease protein